MDSKTKSRIALSISGAILAALSVAVWSDEPVIVPGPEQCSGRWDERLGCIPSYCAAFPESCKACDQPPCGEPIGLVCCEEPIGCFGVFAYSECEGEIYSCEYGFQGRNEDGTAYVICYDE